MQARNIEKVILILLSETGVSDSEGNKELSNAKNYHDFFRHFNLKFILFVKKKKKFNF